MGSSNVIFKGSSRIVSLQEWKNKEAVRIEHNFGAAVGMLGRGSGHEHTDRPGSLAPCYLPVTLSCRNAAVIRLAERSEPERNKGIEGPVSGMSVMMKYRFEGGKEERRGKDRGE